MTTATFTLIARGVLAAFTEFDALEAPTTFQVERIEALTQVMLDTLVAECYLTREEAAGAWHEEGSTEHGVIDICFGEGQLLRVDPERGIERFSDLM